MKDLSRLDPVAVLMLEDSDIDAELIVDSLQSQGGEFSITRTVGRRDFEARLSHGGFHLILSDYSLPDFDGLSALSLAREQLPDVPFIFVSGVIGEEFATEAIKLGAIDYVMKRNLARLPTAVNRALEHVREREERRRAEHALRDSEARARSAEERYRTLFKTMDEGFCIIEFIDGPHGPMSDYVHVEANPAYSAHAGILDVVGQRVRDMVPGEADEWIDVYKEVLVTGAPIRFERELVATSRHLELAAFRIEPPDRRQVAVIFKDVSARKHAEQQLQRLNHELAARVEDAVAERAVALAQLHEAQKMETIGQLTGGVAHDFNNLLTPIVSALEILSRRVNDDRRAKRLADGGLQAAERARTLVQRLLAFSRRQHLEARPVDVGRLAEGMKDLIGRSIGPQIRLTVESEDDLPAALVDPNQFELSLLNLAVNARDAMPDGGELLIKLSAEKIAYSRNLKAGDYVRVSVTDTGVGMDRETMRRAVEPFFTTKDIGRGTGLGLSSVHGLAAQSGGHFELESAIGTGTTAILWLPASEVVFTPTPSDVEGRPAQARSSNACILLVDDEDLVRSATADMLEDVGFKVRQASSGRQALIFLASSEQIDALVTDVAMPAMTGLALAAEARRLKPDLPVLLITGFVHLSEPGTEQLSKIAKPFSQDELARAVERILASPASAGGA